MMLLALVIIALALRVGAIVAQSAWENPSAMEHRAIATFLLQGDGFSFFDWGVLQETSVQSPIYPWFLTLLFYIFGVDSHAAYGVAMGVNALVGAATVWAIFRLAVVMGARPGVALLAAGLFTIWPTQVYLVTHAQAIVLITACMILITTLFYRSMQTGKLGPWIGMSVLGCVAMITEPVLLPPMALTGLLVFIWPGVLNFRQRLRNAAVLLVAAIALLGPWTARNYAVHDRFMPVKSTFWVNVWKGNNPHATGTDRLAMTEAVRAQLENKSMQEFAETARSAMLDSARQYDMLTEEQRAMLMGKREAEREEVFKGFAKSWISEHPGGYARLCAARIMKTLWIDWDNPKAHHPVYTVSRATLLLLTALGLVFAVMRRWRIGFPAVLFFSAMLLYALTITAARFILPFEPFALCFSALALHRGYAMLRGRGESGQEVSAP